MPNPTITAAEVTPSGQLLRLTVARADGTTAKGHISAVGTSITLTVDGVATTYATHPIGSAGFGVLMVPIVPPATTSLVDDSDGGFANTGTATEMVPGSGVAPFFGSDDALNAQYKVLPSSATGTWTHPTADPGRYWVGAHVLDLIDPANAALAVYTVRAGATVLGTFPVDLTARPGPSLRRSVDGRPYLFLGHVVVPSGSTSITITLSTAGSGNLPADATMVASDFTFAPPSGAVVTATLPSGLATVDGVATDAATLPVTFLDDIEFFGPITPPADRTMGIGYNVDSGRVDSTVVTLADRGFNSSKWESGCTLDAHFDMATCTGDPVRSLFQQGPGGDITIGDKFVCREGVIRARAHFSGATFDAAARSRIGLAPDSAYTWSLIGWTDRGGGYWEAAWDLVRKPWPPISQRTEAYSHQWSTIVNFYSSSNPGLLIKEWQWFDPDTPSGYAGTAHPLHVARLKGKVAAIRSMDLFGTNNSAQCNVGDFLSPADRLPPDVTDNVQYYLAGSLIKTIRPVDMNPATDADNFFKWFVHDNQGAWCVVELEDATPFIGRDGSASGISVNPQDYPSTVPGVSVRLGNVLALVYLDPTHLLIKTYPSVTYDSNPGGTPAYANLDATHDLTGTGASVYVARTSMISVEAFCAYCADLDASPWICVPHAATDALIDWMADTTIAGTPDGRKVYVEYSNEHWNPGFGGQYVYFEVMAARYNYLATVDPTNYQFGYGQGSAWYAHRAAHVRDRFRARMTAAGRDPGLIVGMAGSQQMNAGVTEALAYQSNAEGLTFDALTISSYQGSTPNGQGFLGSDAEILDAYRRLGASGCIDVLAESSLRGPMREIETAHTTTWTSYGNPSVPLVRYEGGWDYPIWTGGGGENYARAIYLAPELIMHPRQYRLAAAWESYIGSGATTVNCRYKYESTAEIGGTNTWTEHYSPSPPYGTGDPAENVDWTDYPNTKSQLLGGRMAWASGVDFAATGGGGGGTGGGGGGSTVTMPAWFRANEDARSALASPRSLGGNPVLASAAKFVNFPTIVTAFREATDSQGNITETILTRFTVTAKNTNTLTFGAVAEGATDAALLAGDILECRVDETYARQLQDACDTLSTAVNGVGTAPAPSLDATYAAGKLLGGDGTGLPVAVTVGTGLSLTGTTLAATGGAGGGTPAGADGDIQVYSAGSFGGADDFHWDSTAKSLRVGTATAAAGNYAVQANATGGARCLILTGLDDAGHDHPGEGISLLLTFNDNASPNKQLVFVNSTQVNTDSATGIRMILGFDIPLIDAWPGDRASLRNIGVGQGGSLVGMGFTPADVQADIKAQCHVRAPAADVVAGIDQGHAGQTADLRQWMDSAGNVLGRVDHAGSVFGANLSGTNTGDQDLSGYVVIATTYMNPTWIGSLAGSKITGGIDGITIGATTPVQAQAYRPANAQTGTAYTLVLADNGKLVSLSNAGTITLTVPPNSSVAFPVNSEIDLVQVGAGQVTVAAGGGVTVNSYSGHLALAGQYAGATLKKMATDTWILIGNLA